MEYYVVYIIHSFKSNLYYIGHTSNLQDRLSRHNGNRNKFTRNKGPWELIAAHTCNSKSEAYWMNGWKAKIIHLYRHSSHSSSINKKVKQK